ncbi:hypothetical protein BC830DRAFT_1142315 [Chytriomyces sp. MP71]|nr:hypothetical protein BC830DRAFT_1142315 [Chytriomyces sp. MP71]
MANSTITTSTTTTSMVAASKPVPKPVLKPVPKPRAPSVVPPPATPAASRLKKSASSMSLADTVKKPVASLATARKPASTMDLKAGAAAGRNKTLFPGTTKKPASSTFPAGVPPANAALKTENEKLKKENMDLKMQLESLTMEMQTLKLSSAAPTATVDVPVSGTRYSTDASHTIAEFLTEAGTTQVPAPPPCPAEVEEQIHEETIDAQSPPHASVTVAFVEEVEETYENDFEEEQTQQLEPPPSIPDNVGASAVLPIVLEAEEEMQPEKRMEVVEELQRVGDDEEEEAKRRAMGRRKSVRRATMKVDVPAAAAVEAEVVGVAAEAAEEAAGRALRSRKVRV